MEPRALLAALKRRREKTVDLGDGKTVTFLRPSESEMGGMLDVKGDQAEWNVNIEHVRKCVVGWGGFTAADLLGASIGSSDPVEFSVDLWHEVCADNVEYVTKVARAILTSVVDHISAKGATAKNSEPA